MIQDQTLTSIYKSSAGAMLDTCKAFYTCMERLREVQRRTDADFAEAATRCSTGLNEIGDVTQCTAWQQHVMAEQAARWNQYFLELIQVFFEGQAITQSALRENMDQVQRVYGEMVTALPSMPAPGMSANSVKPPPRKNGASRSAMH